MSTMVSEVKVWHKNWSSFMLKEVVSLDAIQEALEQKGYSTDIFYDSGEEAVILRVLIKTDIFDIAPGFKLSHNGLNGYFAYSDAISVYHEDTANIESKLDILEVIEECK